jgi:hypothetical protein
MQEVLGRVTAKAGGNFRWILNRGFPLWRDTPQLHAVMLEELTPYDLEHRAAADEAWLNRTVLPPLERAKRAGVRAYAMTYGIDRPPPAPTGGVSARIAALTDATVYGEAPALDEWPEELR